MTVEAATGTEPLENGQTSVNLQRARQQWMSVLAKAKAEDLQQRLNAITNLPRYSIIRPAECGAVMVRARAGGTGSPFNFGEISVTRCVVQVHDQENGTVIGHAYIAGRDRQHAESAALLDALMQTKNWRSAIQEAVIVPLTDLAHARTKDRQEKVAATKVDFFTMVRGEN